jgi:uncharacterized RDD family membrane protein YckC
VSTVSATGSAPGSAPETASLPTVTEVRVADPDRRFYAFAIDRLIVWGIDLAVAVLVTHLLISRGHAVVGVLLIVATVLVVGGVFALVVGVTGLTPGKSMLGLRLLHTGSGEPIGIGPAMLRTFVLGVAAVPFGFGLAALAWTALADVTRMRRGWHDHLVSSIVVDTRPAPVVVEAEDAGPRHVVNLTAMRLQPARPTPAGPDLASVPARAPSRPRHAGPITPDVTTERTTVRDSGPAVAGGPEPTAPVALPALTWGLAFDTGELVVVDTLVLIGRRPEPRAGEQGARLVAIPSADMSVSKTHAQVVVATDGALVVTDRGSTNGSTLVRKGMPRELTAGRPATLLDGDVVTLGDRTMTVVRIERGRSDPA